MKEGLKANINKRRAAGTSRPKSRSTISDKIYAQMKAGKGPFKPKDKKMT